MTGADFSNLVSHRATANGARWRARAYRWGAALALHALPLTLIALALPATPKDPGGAFGSAVSVTLVAGVSSQVSAQRPKVTTSDLSALEKRLAAVSPPTTSTAHSSSQPARTSLSELIDAPAHPNGGSSAEGLPRSAAGADDDPFARAAVSYRGDDPIKAARLEAKTRHCAHSTKALRVLMIINSEGRLMAKPQALGASSTDKAVRKTLLAIERCAPFIEASSPGPPRSYVVNLG